MSRFPELLITLPIWVDQVSPPSASYNTLEDRMDLAITLASRNVIELTGGPFGAGIFDPSTGVLVAAGVNMVIPGRAAILHAETVAMALAGQVVGSFDLTGLEMVSSNEPCAMCLGAIPWAGIDRLVCGARHEDATGVGFDEGDKPLDWVALLRRRGIEVVQDVLRAEAVSVLASYAAGGGVIYNGRRGKP